MTTKGCTGSPINVVEKSSVDIGHAESLSVEKNIDHDEVYSLDEQKMIIRRIDYRLVLMLSLLYIVSLMDRINFSTAAIAGLNKELQLQVGMRFSIILVSFSASYTIFHPFGTILTRRIGPRWFLSSVVLAWGVGTIGLGFLHSWKQMAGLRVLIGAFEAGFFPGAVYLMSTWYVRYDLQKRYSAFYGISCVVATFSGILAYGIGKMSGLGGLSGWRWIFIVEGIISCVAALTGYVLLVGFPDDAHGSWNFLSEAERDFVVRRVDRDRGDAITPPFTFGAFLKPARDFRIWVYSFIFFCVITVGNSINYFLPIILLGMGFGVAQAQCLNAPPWIFACFYMFGQAWLSDRYRIRAPFIAFNALLAIIGLAILGWHTHNPTRYFSTFLIIAGSNGNIPPVMTYQANNIRGHWKRAFASALFSAFGGIGGIAGPLVFRSQDQPKYLPGMYASIACNLCVLVCTAGMTVWSWIQNKKAKRGTVVLEEQEGFLYTY